MDQHDPSPITDFLEHDNTPTDTPTAAAAANGHTPSPARPPVQLSESVVPRNLQHSSQVSSGSQALRVVSNSNQKSKTPVLSRIGRRAQGGAVPRRFNPNGEERALLYKSILDSRHWELTKMQQDRTFERLNKRIREDVDAPFRPQTRRGLSVKYIKLVIKNMPRFTVEKRKRFEQRRQELGSDDGSTPTDEDLEDCLSRVEVFDLKMFRIAEQILLSQQQYIQTSTDTPAEAQAGAANARKRRADRKLNSQVAYKKRKKEAKKKEGENENRLRMVDHRMENLMTATVNDNRQTGQLMAGLIKIIGLHGGLSSDQVDEIVGTVPPAPPIEEPPAPQLVLIDESGSEENASEKFEENCDSTDEDNDDVMVPEDGN